MSKQKVPSQRMVRLARKILESAEMRPAAMVKGWRTWTIQWNELRGLARFVDNAAPKKRTRLSDVKHGVVI